MFAAKAYIRLNMNRYIFIFFLFFSGTIDLHAAEISKDSAFRNVQRLFENKPFVHEGSVYKIYEMKLSGDTLQYKVFIENQDPKKSKIYIHRSYDILLKEVVPAYFTTVSRKPKLGNVFN
jgi:hypothetical protein